MDLANPGWPLQAGEICSSPEFPLLYALKKCANGRKWSGKQVLICPPPPRPPTPPRPLRLPFAVDATLQRMQLLAAPNPCPVHGVAGVGCAAPRHREMNGFQLEPRRRTHLFLQLKFRVRPPIPQLSARTLHKQQSITETELCNTQELNLKGGCSFRS